MTEPLFTIGLSAMLFSERLTLMQAAGGVLVLGGTVLLTAVRRGR
jgi:drug/metabolite transporter (DMT)-like permease